MRLNISEILSAISQKPIGSGTEATTYDAGSYVVRVPHTVKIDKAFRDRLSSGAYRCLHAVDVSRSHPDEAICDFALRAMIKCFWFVCHVYAFISTNVGLPNACSRIRSASSVCSAAHFPVTKKEAPPSCCARSSRISDT